jgi:hypothetical protein
MTPLQKLALTALAGLCLSTAACITSGPHFTMAEAQSLRPGVTTRDEAIALLGGPNSISAMPGGSTLVQWLYLAATPYASESRHVSILFGPDNRMIRIEHQSQR